jgi:hypothetical protein
LGTLNEKYFKIVQSITIQEKLPSFHTVTLTLRQLATTSNQFGKSSNPNSANRTAFGAEKQPKVCE